MFLFSDPAPPNLFLLDLPFQKKTDPPSGDDAAGVVIGVICESAALADERGPGRPVVRVNMPASGTFLRTVMRWNLEHKLSGLSGLVRQQNDEQPPARRQDRLVEAGLGPGSVLDVISRLVFFRIRTLRHVFDLEVLDDEEALVRVGDKRTCGLVDHVLPDLLGVFEGPSQPGFGLCPVVRAFPLPGQLPLPAFPGPFLLLDPDLLDGGKIDSRPGAGHHGRRDAPVEAQCSGFEFLFRKHPEPGDRVFLLRFRKTVVGGEGHKPLPRFDREMERGGTGIEGMGLEGQNSCRKPLRPENEFFGMGRVVIPKGKEFGGDPDRLTGVLSLKDRTPGQPGEEPVVGLFPENRPVSENLGGNIPEPEGVQANEPGVFLIDRDGGSGKRDRFFGEDPVIPVFGHLGVVDKPLVPDPLEKDLFLGGCRIRSKSVPCLHEKQNT